MALLALAVPVMIARAGQMTMAVADTLFVGRFSALELAYLGLGAPQGVMLAVLAGLLLGTIVLTAQATGAGKEEQAGLFWRRSLPYALTLGSVMAALCLFAEPFFLLTGQQPDLAAGGAEVMLIYGLGMPGAALFFTTTFFLEGLKRPVPGMVTIVLANILNLFLDWILVFGGLGLPAMGAEGSAWATTIIRWVTAIGLLLYVWRMADRDRYGVRSGGVRPWWPAREQRHLGMAAGASNGLEASAFAALTLFAGLIGPLALGAYTVGLNLIALPFMAALGLASATAVLVGNAYGTGDRRNTQLAGWTGLGVTAALLSVVGLIFAVWPEEIAMAFATEDRLIAVVAPVVAFSAWILVADGGQVVMAQALRGRGDAWVPTVLHFVSYYAVMMPVAYGLGIWAGRGVLGLFEGIFIASMVSVAILSGRFWWLGRKV
ncbi:MATE family efflux transporter [Indioceanicola profundi]|uniref:MATE family efflux transporter n=1 Tax=Indioceanicola profundi TaxID=2220096 RepID=UPI001CED9151|nr:MATE family efflux transporter [Indioceanicola profundi]